jgi:tetratricopeptide (TPR) repeat protein
MIAALAPVLAAALFAAEPSSLQSSDALFLKRREGDSLARSTARVEEALKAQPDDYEALWRLGRNKIAAGDAQQGKDKKLQAYAEAAQPLRKAVDKKPDQAPAHYWLAVQLARENEIRRTLGLAKQMKSELEKALKADPKNADAHQLLGELLHQLPRMFGGDKKRAIAECEEALKLTPNETSRYPALAEAYMADKKDDQAAATLKKVFEVKEPADPASAPEDLANARRLLDQLETKNK